MRFTTDCICGFPGETQADFEESCAFLKKIGFLKVHLRGQHVGVQAAQTDPLDALHLSAFFHQLHQIGPGVRRVYTAEQYAQVVDQIRAAYGARPVSFTTDCICARFVPVSSP